MAAILHADFRFAVLLIVTLAIGTAYCMEAVHELARRQVVAIRGRSPAAWRSNRNARPRRPIRPARCG